MHGIRLCIAHTLGFLILSVPGYAAPKLDTAGENSTANPALSETATAPDIVEHFHATLIQLMQVQDYPSRLELAKPAVEADFSLPTIARISLGANWRSLNAADQTSFQVLLSDLIASTYASRFQQYNGQTFTITKIEPLGANRSTVRSILTTRNETVRLDYQLLSENGRWLIYDIIANGVSDLSLKRSSYAGLFSSGGLTAVREEIAKKISSNALSGDLEIPH